MGEKTWDDLAFWDSGEWQVIQERLDDLKKAKIQFCPKKEEMFDALDATPLKDVKVAIFGQDPYPDPTVSTGIAFSIPEYSSNFPITLVNMLTQLEKDLKIPFPNTGNLEPWCKQGVLLWNVIPSCIAYKPLSHKLWGEWEYLTKEIVETLSSAGILMVFLGATAQHFIKYVDLSNSEILRFSLPTKRGNLLSKSPFQDSHMFSTINAMLKAEGLEPIDWRLNDVHTPEGKG